jgi:hypothetical protein
LRLRTRPQALAVFIPALGFAILAAGCRAARARGEGAAVAALDEQENEGEALRHEQRQRYDSTSS